MARTAGICLTVVVVIQKLKTLPLPDLEHGSGVKPAQ